MAVSVNRTLGIGEEVNNMFLPSGSWSEDITILNRNDFYGPQCMVPTIAADNSCGAPPSSVLGHIKVVRASSTSLPAHNILVCSYVRALSKRPRSRALLQLLINIIVSRSTII